MNKYILILAALFLTACSPPTPPLTNDEIIVEVKKCEAAGMEAVLFSSEMSFRTHVVECRPRSKK